MDDVAVLRLLQVVDSQVPVGGFAHSYGLEAYGPLGVTPFGLSQLVDLHVSLGSLHLDLAACALARLWAPDEARLEALGEELTAWKAVRGPREASLQVGRRLTYLAQRALGLCPPRLSHPHAAVVLGALAATLEIPPRMTLLAFAHASLAGLLAAATRCLRIGPLRAQTILADIHPSVVETVEEVLRDPEAALWAATPGWDIRSHQQAFLTTRLFLS